MAQTKRKIQLTVHICNAIISLLCILSIAAYFFLPFWKLDVSYRLDAETIQEMLGETSEDSADGFTPSDSSLEDSSGEDSDVGEIDFSEILTEPIDLHLSLTLKTQDVMSALNEEPTIMVEKIIEYNINSLVDQIYQPLSKLVKNTAKVVAKTTLKEQLHSQIQDLYEDPKTSAEVEEMLKDAGITDSYIDYKTDQLIEDIYAEDATVSSVTESIVDAVDEVCNKLHETGNEDFTDIKLTEETKQELREEISEAIKDLSVDGEKIDVDALLSELLLGFLNGEEVKLPETASTNNVRPTSVKATSNTPTSTEEVKDAQAELKNTIRQAIMDEIPQDLATTIAEVMKYISYLLLFTFFTWAYLILKILAKLKKPNNAIKLKLPIWLGTIPYVFLCLIPNAIFSTLTNPPMNILNELGTEAVDAFESLKTATANLSISCSSGGVVSFYVAIFFLLFGLFYYGGLRRKLKKYQKGILVDSEEDTLTEKIKKTKPNKKETKKSSSNDEYETLEEDEYEEPPGGY